MPSTDRRFTGLARFVRCAQLTVGAITVAAMFGGPTGLALASTSRSAPAAASLDRTYGQSGSTYVDTGRVVALARGGGAFVAELGLAVSRVDADGRPDARYGTAGRSPVLSGGAIASGIDVGTDGSVLVTGRAVDANTTVYGPPTGEVLVARLLPDGTPDVRFGRGGVVSLGRAECCTGVLAPDDGSVTLMAFGGLQHLTAGGTLDGTFGQGGTAPFPGGDGPTRIYRAPAGGLFVLSADGDDGRRDIAISRYDRRGKLISTFGAAGTRTFRHARDAALITNANGYSTLISGVDCDRSVEVGCHLVQRRLSPSGRIIASKAIDAAPTAIRDATRDAAGRTIIGVSDDKYLSGSVAQPVLRLTPDGQRDARFGHCGVGAPRAGAAFAPTSVAVQPDGRIIQAGPVYSVGRFPPAQGLGLVLTAQRGGSGSPNLMGRPTSAPVIRLPGTLSQGLTVGYVAAVKGHIEVEATDLAGHRIGLLRASVTACSTIYRKLRLSRRPSTPEILLRSTATGAGRRLRTTTAACVTATGAITSPDTDESVVVETIRRGGCRRST